MTASSISRMLPGVYPKATMRTSAPAKGTGASVMRRAGPGLGRAYALERERNAMVTLGC
jgi:hypothetical protein